MAGLGILVILADLVIGRKRWLSALALAGLVVPLWFVLAQLSELPGGLGSFGTDNLVPATSVLADSLSVDRFGTFLNLLVVATLALVFLASVSYVNALSRLQGEFYGLMLLSASGMMLLASATELITIYVALELTTLPLVAIAAFLPNSRSSEAGMKFLVIGAISSGLTLYGMALLYGFSGSTTLSGIALALSGPVSNEIPFGSYAVLIGVAVLTAGIAFKLSSVPSQIKAVAFALLLRVLYSGFLIFDDNWGMLLAVLAALSMTVGNLVAIAQSNIRRLLGYSTIAHAGYILVGVAAVTQGVAAGDDGGLFTTFGPSSVLFYLVAYSAANLTAFFAILAIHSRIGSDLIEDYGGVFTRYPFVAIALALALVALIGVPPTGIFIGKIYLFLAAVKSDLAWLAILGAVNSVISAYYYIRIIRVMFLSPESEAVAAMGYRNSSTASGLNRNGRFSLTVVALTVTAVCTVLLGIAFEPILQAAESAVTALPGVLAP
ncbi:NADH-quinone oxidoreductase subunit N [Geodia barretti]|uniref:NADH:ubiquinone reductase (H(+)-translocating) n=1 Tax=Geodia barretti TaxID=519541 RepID=A0AA35WJH0_GEOBA|nr:NADH-quinone oxidoreductase subunit N [Geodia barretti]